MLLSWHGACLAYTKLSVQFLEIQKPGEVVEACNPSSLQPQLSEGKDLKFKVNLSYIAWRQPTWLQKKGGGRRKKTEVNLFTFSAHSGPDTFTQLSLGIHRDQFLYTDTSALTKNMLQFM